jgi:hypothetical protein
MPLKERLAVAADKQSCSVNANPFLCCHSGAGEAREPGIHNHHRRLWIPGSRRYRGSAAMTN